MNSVIGQSSVWSLLGKSSQVDSGSRGEESSIYSMLQAVCGSVSQMRESPKKENINRYVVIILVWSFVVFEI